MIVNLEYVFSGIGMDEGGQTVTPAVTPGADLSMLHGQMLIQLQLQLDIATDQEVWLIADLWEELSR